MGAAPCGCRAPSLPARSAWPSGELDGLPTSMAGTVLAGHGCRRPWQSCASPVPSATKRCGECCPIGLTQCTFSFFLLSLCLSLGGFGVISLFSFQMHAPPKLFLNLLYKMEGPHGDDFTVALELTTWHSSRCHDSTVTVLPSEDGEDPMPPVLPTLTAGHSTDSAHFAFPQSPTASTTPVFSQPHHLPCPGYLLPAVTVPRAGPAGECPASTLHPGHAGIPGPAPALFLCPRCYEQELQGCILRDLSLLVSRKQASPQETSFSCLLGELRVGAVHILTARWDANPATAMPCADGATFSSAGAGCGQHGSLSTAGAEPDSLAAVVAGWPQR